jgi:hypothetical protein
MQGKVGRERTQRTQKIHQAAQIDTDYQRLFFAFSCGDSFENIGCGPAALGCIAPIVPGPFDPGLRRVLATITLIRYTP